MEQLWQSGDRDLHTRWTSGTQALKPPFSSPDALYTCDTDVLLTSALSAPDSGFIALHALALTRSCGYPAAQTNLCAPPAVAPVAVATQQLSINLNAPPAIAPVAVATQQLSINLNADAPDAVAS